MERQIRRVVFNVQNIGLMSEEHTDEFMGTSDEFASFMQLKWEALHEKYYYVELLSTTILSPDSRLDVGTFPLPIPH